MSALTAVEVPAPLAPEVALQGMYERNADRILGFCRRRLRTQQEAEDAVQETFLSAMRALQRGCVPVCESAWLFKIAENVCCTMYRSALRKNTAQLTGFEEIERVAAPTSDGDALFGLEQALESIPPNQRRAFLLRELRGLSYREIALQLGVSVASVETLIFRARRGLAKALESGAGLRERISAGLNVGSIAAALKSWLAGATAAKVATATVVLAVAGVSAGDAPTRSPQVGEPVSATEPKPASVNRSSLEGAGALQGEAGRVARPATTSTPQRTPAPQHGRRTPVPVRKEAVRRDSGPAQESTPAPDAPAPGAPQSPAPQPAPAVPAAPQPPAVVAPITLPEAPVSVPEAPALPAVPPVPSLPVELPDLSEQLPVVPPLG
jgi:RNA polymerase sigma-70 factor (ECF subfamily)